MNRREFVKAIAGTFAALSIPGFPLPENPIPWADPWDAVRELKSQIGALKNPPSAIMVSNTTWDSVLTILEARDPSMCLVHTSLAEAGFDNRMFAGLPITPNHNLKDGEIFLVYENVAEQIIANTEVLMSSKDKRLIQGSG